MSEIVLLPSLYPHIVIPCLQGGRLPVPGFTFQAVRRQVWHLSTGALC